MAEYGIPYMGSKSAICNTLIKLFPKADHFYDLFGGGFSVTHAMLERRPKDYKHFHFNELRPGICDLIQRAIKGEYNYSVYQPKFIGREEFFAKRDTDPLIKIIWSFGNYGKTYLFSKEIEPYKKSLHNAVVFNEFDELAKQVFGFERFKDGYDLKDRRLYLRERAKRKATTDKIKQLQHLLQLEQLQQLEQSQQLQQLERLSFYNASYEKIKIEKNSVVYCDPPYAGTAEYDKAFDHKKFFDWANDLDVPVFISEYNVPDKRFTCVFDIKKRSLFSLRKDKQQIKKEKVYANHCAKKLLYSNLRRGV